MNNITIAGNIGRSELKDVNGTALLSFSVAVERSYQKDKDNKVTDWFNCSLWGKRATALEEYLVKGCGVAVSGEMQSNKKDDKTYWNINVNDISIMKWPEDGGNGNTEEVDSDDFSSVEDSEGDIPF